MMILRLLAVIFGVALIVLVALDAFETIVLPRRVTRRIRLALIFYRTARLGWVFLSHLFRSGSRRDAFLGYVGPLSLLGLLLFWAVLFVFGFALLLWGLALPLNALDHAISFLTYLYLSGTTFFTLGLGDITPVPGLGRFLVVSEVAFGFVFLALVISYVPVIYQAFSRRERRISLLDAQAGSPPTAVELLCRNSAVTHPEELRTLLHEWEVWCADILESHLSYPILAYYRSQHEQQSWVEALTLILDSCALILTSIQDVMRHIGQHRRNPLRLCDARGPHQHRLTPGMRATNFAEHLLLLPGPRREHRVQVIHANQCTSLTQSDDCTCETVTYRLVTARKASRGR